jgi:hypothetical protein
MGNLKSAVVSWVAETLCTLGTPQQPALEPTVKCDRGFVHNHTGQLLCPSEFDWARDEYVHNTHCPFPTVLTDLRVRKNIREGHPNFMVTAQSWPTFLYKNLTVDKNDFEKGLFKSSLLLRVAIVTIL